MFHPFETPSLINALQPQLYHLFSHDGPLYCVLNLITICFNSLMHDEKGALTSGCLLKQKNFQRNGFEVYRFPCSFIYRCWTECCGACMPAFSCTQVQVDQILGNPRFQVVLFQSCLVARLQIIYVDWPEGNAHDLQCFGAAIDSAAWNCDI